MAAYPPLGNGVSNKRERFKVKQLNWVENYFLNFLKFNI
jgi:hypothetical protein